MKTILKGLKNKSIEHFTCISNEIGVETIKALSEDYFRHLVSFRLVNIKNLPSLMQTHNLGLCQAT